MTSIPFATLFSGMPLKTSRQLFYMEVVLLWLSGYLQLWLEPSTRSPWYPLQHTSCSFLENSVSHVRFQMRIRLGVTIQSDEHHLLLPASEAHGVCGAWILWMVCLQIPPFQGDIHYHN